MDESRLGAADEGGRKADGMDNREVRKMERMSKRDLIGIAEALAIGIEREQEANYITRLALNHTQERAEKAEAERDQYRGALEAVCLMLDGSADEISCAFSIALSPFAAKGESMADLWERLKRGD